MACDVQPAPIYSRWLDVFVEMDEVDEVVTHRRAHDDEAVDEQVALVLDKDEKGDGTQETDDEASNGDEEEVFHALVEPLHTDTCKNNGETEDIE